MAKVTVVVWDEDGEVKTTGDIDPPDAVTTGEVTPAAIIGLFLHSHMAQIYKAAIEWGQGKTTDHEEPVEVAPKLYIPDADIKR